MRPATWSFSMREISLTLRSEKPMTGVPGSCGRHTCRRCARRRLHVQGVVDVGDDGDRILVTLPDLDRAEERAGVVQNLAVTLEVDSQFRELRPGRPIGRRLRPAQAVPDRILDVLARALEEGSRSLARLVRSVSRFESEANCTLVRCIWKSAKGHPRPMSKIRPLRLRFGSRSGTPSPSVSIGGAPMPILPSAIILSWAMAST